MTAHTTVATDHAHDEAVDIVAPTDAIFSRSNLENEKEVASSARVTSSEDYLETQHHILTGTKSSTADAYDMRRMGKDQQLVRHFRFFTLASFTAICTASWELGLLFLSPALINGGRAGLIWNLVWNFLGFTPICFSIAEMASISPIAGCHYHWVSEFAPENCQQFLSYLTGHVSCLSSRAHC